MVDATAFNTATTALRSRSASEPNAIIPHRDCPIIDLPQNIERMFETFHQVPPKGQFKPTFYNPFEIKHRRRTTKDQFKILEAAFQDNNKPSASARRTLAAKLCMTPRAVQVWFQNRRAKSKSTSRGDSPNFDDAGQSSADTLASPHLTSVVEVPKPRPRGIVGKTGEHGGSLSRRYSMPEIQHQATGSLPFKELHEAIFGRMPHHRHNHGHAHLLGQIHLSRPQPPPLMGLSHPLEISMAARQAMEQSFMGSYSVPPITMLPAINYSRPSEEHEMYDPMVGGNLQHLIKSSAHLANGVSPCSNYGHQQVLMGLESSTQYEGYGSLANRTEAGAGAESYLANYVGPAGSESLAGLLYSHHGDNSNNLSVNPIELLSCLPGTGDHYLYGADYADHCIDGSHFE